MADEFNELDFPVSNGNDADNLAVISEGIELSGSFLYAFDDTTWDRLRSVTSTGDGVAAAASGNLRTYSQGVAFNGATFDRLRANTEETILASAARTASVNSADFTNHNAKGAHFIVDVSADPAAASITVKVQGKDPISGNYYDILVSNAIVSVGTNLLKVFPGITTVANAAASDILPRTYRISVTAADADSITYSVSAAPVV